MMAGRSRRRSVSAFRRDRFQNVLELVVWLLADQPSVVDEEGRRRFDLELLLAGKPAGQDLLLAIVIRHARLKLLVAHPAELRDAAERLGRVAATAPARLRIEQHVDEAVE